MRLAKASFFFLLFLKMSICQGAWAQQRDPFEGEDQFPQFRNLSGLAGGGFGVDEHGLGSYSGPTAFSTPVAPTLGHDHFRFLLGGVSTSSTPSFTSSGTNNSGVLMFGHTAGQFNVALTTFFKSSKLDYNYNLQVQYVPRGNARLVGSLGVQDVIGRGGSAGEGFPTDSRTSRSFFGVVTYRLDTPRNPVYLSGGIGTRRFGKEFASISYQVVKPVRTFVEYDGWGFNEGVLFTVRTGSVRTRLPELNAMVGLVRGQYFAFSTGIGF